MKVGGDEVIREVEGLLVGGVTQGLVGCWEGGLWLLLWSRWESWGETGSDLSSKQIPLAVCAENKL